MIFKVSLCENICLAMYAYVFACKAFLVIFARLCKFAKISHAKMSSLEIYTDVVNYITSFYNNESKGRGASKPPKKQQILHR